MSESIIIQILKRCQNSFPFFIKNFGTIKHPDAGKIPFNLFNYQQESIKKFQQHRFNVFKKTRQAGISTLCGAYALWYAMFKPYKTILIVSKRDKDAMEFLDKNVKFIYNNLPKSIKKYYGDPEPETYNQHQIIFPNGSQINSLPSGPDTLRSNSSSLNIIDEASAMPHMSDMWAGGWSTIMHGGSVIIISTARGTSNWYYQTWNDAENQRNDFNPIIINWWDMTWTLRYKNQETGETKEISPTKDIRKTNKEEEQTYGPYWSPWLEEQWRNLQQRNEGHLFRQEVLGEFVGTGNSVLQTIQLNKISTDLEKYQADKYHTINKVTDYNPATEETIELNFENKLKIWQKPIRPTPDIMENGKIIKPGSPGHTYIVGVDISSGEAKDFSSVEIIDINNREQVAELNLKVMVPMLLPMVHYLARYYNLALIIPERNGLGLPFCQDLWYKYGYPNVYKTKNNKGKPTNKIGYSTTGMNKPTLNKALLELAGTEEGIIIKSRELYEQLKNYIHLPGRRTGCPEEIGHDDLVIAFGLALMAIPDALNSDTTTLIPFYNTENPNNNYRIEEINKKGGNLTLAPYNPNNNTPNTPTPEQELKEFTKHLGGLPMTDSQLPQKRNPHYYSI